MRFKGVRPRVVNRQGRVRIYSKGQGISPWKLDISPQGNLITLPQIEDPLGGMTLEGANNEREAMSGDALDTHATDSFLLLGTYNNLFFGRQKKKIAFVVSGMEHPDARFGFCTDDMYKKTGARLLVIEAKTGVSYAVKDENAVCRKIGNILRHRHETGRHCGMFHFGNIGIDIVDGSLGRVIFRDHEAAGKTDTAKRNINIEAGLRFMDIQSILYDIIVLSAEHSFSDSEMVKFFLRGYFYDLDDSSVGFMAVQCDSTKFVIKMEQIVPIQGRRKPGLYEMFLSEDDQVIGALYEQLIRISAGAATEAPATERFKPRQDNADSRALDGAV